MSKVVVVTGAGAGVGRATVIEFAKAGYDIGLLSRDPDRLENVASLVRQLGVQAIAIPTDVADADAVEAAAARIEAELGPIDVWVNLAMVTIFAPLSELTAAEFERGTKVTYLGQVHGTMSALRRMRVRNRGTIINVGSTLGHRSVPLQSMYCGAQFAVRGFTDSLRSEIIHDGLDIQITEVDLPAINTPVFDWALNKTGRRASPIAPIYQPEVAARAILFAATHNRRHVWVGLSTLKAIIGTWLAPGFMDGWFGVTGYASQLTDQHSPANAPSNLFKPVKGEFGAHGRFDYRADEVSPVVLTDRHRTAIVLGALGIGALLLRRMVRGRRSPPPPRVGQ